MNGIVGWLGFGKLGMPCGLTLALDADVHLIAYDPSPDVPLILTGDLQPRNSEAGLADMIEATHGQVTLGDCIADVVSVTDGIIFVAIQTPHAPEYGGEIPMPDTRADFDYSALQAAVKDVARCAADIEKPITLVVISTALPGTMRREILPHLGDYVTLVYCPHFIAMGTTIHDYRNPEFLLIGTEDRQAAQPVIDLYRKVHAAPLQAMSLESAELVKVAYNTVISTKIVFANTLMEICTQTGADIDQVTGALKQATDRVVSTAYMDAGMGDGGACHPRDLIAMSWLAQKLDLSNDIFTHLVEARENQTRWLAERVVHEAENRGLPIVILGKAYKPGSDLVSGSPALLLAHYLTEMGVKFEHVDQHVDDMDTYSQPYGANLYVIATKHPEYRFATFDPGSAVLDVFRFVRNSQPDVEVIGVGRGWPTEEREGI